MIGLKRSSSLARLTISMICAAAIPANAVQGDTQEPLQPLPQSANVDAKRAALGERLFHDRRLSHDNNRSCSSCHALHASGAQHTPRAIAANGKSLLRNTPTVFNAVFNLFCNWDGTAKTLRTHAEKVLLSPNVMNTSWPEVLAKLRADPDYVAAFRTTYKQDIDRVNVLDAIASFEQSLITPNSRFDQYLQGKRDALTEAEQNGYQLFKSYGCVACHQGVNVGGNLFQKFGVFQPPQARRGADAGDLGRFQVTKRSRDREVFRVPSLRNVATTAPYFHDGRAATLEAAVETMAKVQLGRQLSAHEIGLLVQFLNTLTGEWRGKSVTASTQ